ncbi:helix-turn-helix domain-containing protein [Dactylosporangium vinaceum]|uniref:GlxA family transcriptional regulator n=1 Tax=Dactylosporangium vinaceum TaxID=53362 RepID=A0ABV5MN90_9ACTN|nr:helix-turn-helix domain-containing protein [Dactylosporangium vinaceum]UAB98563.1 helix-turn-helix domain-containing protein [Dactylosporangium vinaceum]
MPAHRVVVLAVDGVYPFEMTIPKRIFGTAGAPDGTPLYEVLTCGVHAGPGPGTVRTDADFAVAVEHGPELLSTADTVVIPPFVGCSDDSGDQWLPASLKDALARVAPGVRIVSMCTAAFALAAAGRLDGRPATTHWNRAEQFRAAFPDVELRPDVLFVDDGDVLTAAGVAAGVDLCLHLVRRDHGSEVANRVARLCIVPPWRDGGQAQYVEQPVPSSESAGTAEVREWALERLHEPLTLAALAGRARMSVRTFSRRFRGEVGLTPLQWVTAQRVAYARKLLETTDWPVDRVAASAGFGTGASLRLHLHTNLGVSPMAYRSTFRSGRQERSIPAG